MVDRVGRVKLILIGTALQVLILCIITAIVALYAGGPNTQANSAAIALFFIFFIADGAFVEPHIYTYVSEIFPSHLRAKGITFGITFLYLVVIPLTTYVTQSQSGIRKG